MVLKFFGVFADMRATPQSGETMRLLPLFAVFALTVAVGCNSSDFAGGGSKAPSDSKAEPKPKTKTPQSGDGNPADTATATHAGTSGDTGSTAPTTAVTAGSFKAWAEPANPVDDQDYTIFIEVKLPPGIVPTSYTKEDLSGLLVGTDQYQQAIEASFAPIPGPLPIIPPWQPRGTFNVTGNVARISFMVPGAESKVKDTINIKSRALNESQTVSIVFQ